jgi:hypothetical protein|tara:strand:- start:2406 stop:2744 length:339 start_codon:yes stop_codon:yes gene_type:complete
MRTSFVIVSLMIGLLFAKPAESTNDKTYDLTVMQINARWNKKNEVKINKLKYCNVEWAYLEDQNTRLQKKFNKIPFIVIKKGNTPLLTWEGNILFEPTVTLEEIQQHINNHR